MSRVKRIALLLAVVMLLSVAVVSCADKGNENNNNNNWYLPDTGDRASTPDNLPDNLDYKGYSFEIFYRAGDFTNFYECEGSNDPDTKNIIYTAVYERNLKVEARLSCELNWIPSSNGGLAETKAEINQVLLRNEWFDFIISTNNTSLQLGQNQFLADLRYTTYIDLDQPWWWSDVIDELSYDGYSINFICGDINVINILKMSAFYFNTELCETYLHMDAADFYKLVDDKQWTIEKLMTLSNTWIDTGIDPGGTNMQDQNDILAFPYVGGETVNQFLWSTKVVDNLYKRLPSGLVEFHLQSDETVNEVVELMRKLIHQCTGAWKKSSGYDSDIIKEFASGNYFFLPQRLTAVASDFMREMDNDFGIIPYPTLEAGDDYISHIQSSSTSICVPAVVEMDEEAFDRSSALIEALCAEAYRTTTEAFYETALKNRYTRDEDARRMIDVIYNSADKNFLIEYNEQAGSVLNNLYSAVWNDRPVTAYLESANDSGMNAINDFISKAMKSAQ